MNSTYVVELLAVGWALRAGLLLLCLNCRIGLVAPGKGRNNARDLLASGLHSFELVWQNKYIKISEATPNLILSNCLDFGILIEHGEFIFEFSKLPTSWKVDRMLFMFDIVRHSSNSLFEQIVKLVVLACSVVLLGIVEDFY